MRNEIDDLVTTAAWVIDAARRPRPTGLDHWLDVQTTHLTVDLAAIDGVCASKAKTFKVDDIAARVPLPVVQKQRPNQSAEQLLRAGLVEAFGKDQPATAIRFGEAGEVYLCNYGGSHRIAAVRAEYRRERRAYPLSLTLRTIEPGVALCALLAAWEVIAVAVQLDAQTALLRHNWRRRDRRTTATGWGPAIVAVIRRGSYAANTAKQLVDEGRAFGLRQFLEGQGCRL